MSFYINSLKIIRKFGSREIRSVRNLSRSAKCSEPITNLTSQISNNLPPVEKRNITEIELSKTWRNPFKNQKSITNAQKIFGKRSDGNDGEIDRSYISPIDIEIPDQWPQVPLVSIDQPLFPNFTRSIEITDPTLMIFLRKICFDLDQPWIGTFLKRSGESKIYSVGTFAQIVELKDYGDKLKAMVMGHRRIELSDEPPDGDDPDEPIVIVNVENCLSEFDPNDRVKVLRQEVARNIQQLIFLNPTISDHLSTQLPTDQSVQSDTIYLCDLGAQLTTANTTEIQDVLEERDISNRLMLTLALLKKQMALVELQTSIEEEIDQKIKRIHRTFVLNEQLRIIKRELGQSIDDKETIIEKYRDQIKDRPIPSEVQSVIDQELNRLNVLEQTSAEFSLIRNYLDWLVQMPWGRQTDENLDLERAETILNEHHFGMDEIKRRILEFMAVSQLRKTCQGKILCFHGPPGVGKTSVARSIAESLNRKYFRFSVGGMDQVSEIKGHRRTYVGAMPGKIAQCLKLIGTENPLILIDEIDKLSKSKIGGGDPSSAMLELLDPEQNLNFYDYYLDVPIDLSKVLFICTANRTDTIPIPLQDRMELIEMFGYVDEEKMAIAQKYLLPKLIEGSGLASNQIQFTDDCLKVLIQNYCQESGVRNLKRQLEKIIRKIAYKTVTETSNDTELVVTSDTLEEYLGKPPFLLQSIYKTTPPGVVMGLGWTETGGSTIFVETAKRSFYGALTKKTTISQPKIRLTGHLGPIIKESAEIALTVARNQLKRVNNNSARLFLDTNQIHVHIPKGSIRKDGPSAGITIGTAIISLALGKSVRQQMAMTGEISLGGKVLPVGGVKEKTIAAKRSGIKYIVIPEDNRKDFMELPEYITEGLEVFFVQNFDEVFRIAFGYKS